MAFGIKDGQTSQSKSDKKPSDRETQRLKGTLERQKGTAERLKKPEPGGFWGILKDIKDVTVDPIARGTGDVLGGVLDVVQRGQYAVAEPVTRVLEHLGTDTPEARERAKGGVLGDVLGGLVGGLAGREKTSFNEALLRAAEADPDSLTADLLKENRYNIRTGLGLVGDIALDPLTYTPGGLFKIAGAAEDINKARKVAADVTGVAMRSPEADKLASEAAQNVIKKTRKGKAVPAKIQAAADKARLTYATEQGNVAHKQFLKDTERSLQVRWGDKTLVNSRAAYRYGKSTAKAAKRIPGVEAITDGVYKAMSLSSILPGRTRRAFRVAENNGAEWLRVAHREVDNVIRGLTKEERKLVTHAIDEGYRLTGITATKTGKALDQVIDEAKAIFNELHAAEFTEGIIGKSQYIQDYVPHHYRNIENPLSQKFKKSRRQYLIGGAPSSSKTRKLGLSLRAAEEAGLNPVTDIGDLLKIRAAKSMRARARVNYVRMVDMEYGTKVDGKWTKIAKKDKEGNVIEEIDRFVPSKLGAKQLKEQGLVIPKVDYWDPSRALPKEISETLGRLDEMYRVEDEAAKFVKQLDKIQGHWKFMATAANLGHHMRNMVGDAWLNYLDGVVDPRVYEQSRKLIWARNQGDELGDAIKSVRIGDITVNGRDIYTNFTKMGAKSGMISTELPVNPIERIGSAIAGAGAGRVGEKVAGFGEGIQKWSENREDFMRLAHFIDALKKEGAGVKNLQQLEEAAGRAADRVRHWNIDYGDVTQFQRKYLRRAMPFSTFATKNFPLQVEALLTNPGKIANVPKATRAIEQLLGTDEDSLDYENIMPDWLKAMAPIRLKGEGAGSKGLYIAPGFTLPEAADWVSTGQEGLVPGMFRNVLSRLSPALTLPIEMATGRSLFTGGPRPEGTDVLTGLVPLARTGADIAQGETSVIKLLNYLSGAGLREITPEQQRGQLRKEQDVVQRQIRERRTNK